MPKTKISEYSATANSNTDVASINIDEGCAPSGINNAIRAVMGHLKDFQSGTNADPFNGPVNGTVGATTPASAAVTTLTTSSTVTHNGGTANGVAYLNGSKVLTTGSALQFDDSNLGLGVTPSAWGTGKAIQGDGGSVWFRGVSGGINCVYNYAFTAAANRYIANGYASRYTQLDGQHIFYTAPSGTAGNAISFTQAMTLDASGQLALGRTSAASQLDVERTTATTNSTAGILNLRTACSATAAAGLGSFVNFLTENANGTQYETAYIGAATESGAFSNKSGYIFFSTALSSANPVERMRIDSSGNLLVGTTSAILGGQLTIAQRSGSTSPITCDLYNASTKAIKFGWYGSEIGSISVNAGGTAIAYNTSSDYRLKTVIGPVADAGSRIDALEPIEYEWKSDGSRTRGFLAHKFQEVYAGSVNGTKDAVDAEGKPVYQSMQASSPEVIADLVAEIQSLRKRLAAAGI